MMPASSKMTDLDLVDHRCWRIESWPRWYVHIDPGNEDNAIDPLTYSSCRLLLAVPYVLAPSMEWL